MHLLRMCTFVSTKASKKRCCTCRQVNNILCDASAKPSNRRPCNATSCAVEARALKLRFTPWSACEAECGNGYNGRAAVCANADGIAVDPTACSGYTGASMSADVASEMAYVILNGIDKCFTCVSFPIFQTSLNSGGPVARCFMAGLQRTYAFIPNATCCVNGNEKLAPRCQEVVIIAEKLEANSLLY